METTQRAGSLAAFDNMDCVHALTLPEDRRTTESLAASVNKLLSTVEWRPCDVELVAVSIGPGSFTGARIGVTAAKVFAFAVGAQVVGVDTRDVIAARMPVNLASVCVLIDAQRGDVVGRRYRRDSAGTLQPVADLALQPLAAALAALEDDEPVASPSAERWARRHTPTAGWVPVAIGVPSADAVGRLAIAAYHHGQGHSIWTLSPLYHRPSAAEEKRARGSTPGVT